jgi:hypothetical protein
MRAHNNEHRDSLPVLDVSALKHVAYVFDTLIYNMRASSGDISQQVGNPVASISAAAENRESSFLNDAWENQVCSTALLCVNHKLVKLELILL